MWVFCFGGTAQHGVDSVLYKKLCIMLMLACVFDS